MNLFYLFVIGANNFDYFVLLIECGTCCKDLNCSSIKYLRPEDPGLNSKMKGKTVRDAFFTQDGDDPKKWKCRCGKTRTVEGTGYTNFVTHAQLHHAEAYAELERTESCAEISAGSGRNAVGTNLFFPKKAVQIHGVLEFVVSGLFPFHILNKTNVMRHVRYEKIDVKTLKKYMDLVTKSVERKISSLIPKKFALVFDGWTAGSEHYVAVFAVFPSDCKDGFKSCLLAFSTFDDGSTQSATAHVEFLDFVLEVFGQDMNNVVALIADNCNTNRLIAEILDKPLLGCNSHRFNIAVVEFMSCHNGLINKISILMSKLRFPVAAAKLRKHTELRALGANRTRWSSTFVMLNRYLQIRQFIGLLHISGIEELMLTPTEEKEAEKLCQMLSDFDSVTKALQSNTVTLSEVRVLFDSIITAYPSTIGRLSTNSPIVSNPDFEKGIVKIQTGRSTELTLNESIAVSSLNLNIRETVELVDNVNEENMSFAMRALKRARLTSAPSDKYVNTRFLLPTSNICERLFSVAGKTLSDNRKSILPSNLEQQIFLNANSDLWGLKDVNSVLDS